jgi:aspartate 1-decarboxylase
MLKSKIHGARVTQANLYYKGSITIDYLLMKKADILPAEKVEVLNVNTGNRIETYAIKGKPGSGVICLNGPAARSGCVGDELIILSYALVEESQAQRLAAKIIKLNERNKIKD